MFHIDVGRGSAGSLRLGHDVLADGGLTGRLRSIDLGDASARHASDAQCNV